MTSQTVTVVNQLGVSLSILGIALYNILKYREMQRLLDKNGGHINVLAMNLGLDKEKEGVGETEAETEEDKDGSFSRGHCCQFGSRWDLR